MRKGVCAGFAAMLLAAGSAAAQNIRVWAIDPLVKVFPDAVFPLATSQPDPQSQAEGASIEMSAEPRLDPFDAARGEHASFQFVVRIDGAIKDLRVSAGPLAYKDGRGDAIQPQPARFVGFVPVERPTPDPSKDRLRVPPCVFPDPLLQVESIDVPAGRAQPVWITVPIPNDAEPGFYRGEVTFTGTIDGSPFELTRSYDLRVHDVTIDSTRLWITNWATLCWKFPPGPDDTAYWGNLRRHARMMADHRQNVFIISPLHMTRFSVGDDGELAWDFSLFDKAVQLFIDEGVIGRLEGAHIGGRSGGWETQFVASVRRVKDGKVDVANLPPDDPDVEKFFARYLPALVAHLRDKRWLDRYMQHIADEPTDRNVATYEAILAIVRRHAPELRIIDAIHTRRLVGKVDVAVPMLNYLHGEYATYRQHPGDGRELWFYTCVQPQGEYANRFMELPLLKTRILHWINFKYDLTGYLHWGYNFYLPGDPFKNTTASAPADYWPAGDPYIVYPGPDGGPLSSIRFEAMRDGIVDHELLSMLAERDRAAAKGIADRHVRDFDKYELDLAAFRATRREILEKLAKQ